MRRLALALPVALASCTHSDPAPLAATDAGSRAPTDASALVQADAGASVANALTRLGADGVSDEHFERRVFYTWTTVAQIEALAAATPLLTRMESSKTGRSTFDVRLDEVIAKDPTDKIARLLRGGKTGLAYRRFAWPSAWPTRVPLGTVDYGDQLLRVVLKPDSVIARFDATATPRWSFVSVQGTAVSRADVEANPARLAAVFHVHRQDGVHFREYVLCNESMVESWSYGSAETAAELATGAALMAALAERPDADATLAQQYADALAFPDVAAYALTAHNTLQLERSLRLAVQSHAPLAKTVALAFDAAPVALPPRRPYLGPT